MHIYMCGILQASFSENHSNIHVYIVYINVLKSYSSLTVRCDSRLIVVMRYVGVALAARTQVRSASARRRVQAGGSTLRLW